MAYAALAAIHLFVLLGKYAFMAMPIPTWYDVWYFGNTESSKAYGDVDFYGIVPVLAAAGIMLGPILNWSTTFRKHKARSVILYWGAIIIVALLAAIVCLFRGLEVNTLPSFVSCEWTPDGPCNWESAYELAIMTEDHYERCHCYDFCALLQPSAPLRRGAPMVADLTRSISLNSTKNGNNMTLFILWKMLIFCLIYIVTQGVISILASQSSQTEVRNHIFRFLIGRDNRRASENQPLNQTDDQENTMPRGSSSIYRMLRQRFATFVAACFYVGAILGAVFAPFIFLLSVVVNELMLGFYPVSEHSDAVGAWSAWVGAGLIILASFLASYHDKWIRGLELTAKMGWNCCRSRHGISSDQETLSKAFTETFADSGRLIVSPAVHGWNMMRLWSWLIVRKSKAFQEWWKDPIRLSRKGVAEQYDEKLRSDLTRPHCNCYMCGRKIVETNEAFDSLLQKASDPKADFDNLRQRVKQLLGDDYDLVHTSSSHTPSTTSCQAQNTSTAQSSPFLPPSDFPDTPAPVMHHRAGYHRRTSSFASLQVPGLSTHSQQGSSDSVPLMEFSPPVGSASYFNYTDQDRIVENH